MSLEFEGDIAGLDEVQLNLFREVFQKHGYDEGTVTVEPLQNKENIKRLSIEGEDGPFKMVAKVAPKQEMLRLVGNTETIFRNETFMYTQVFPKLKELQKSVDIPDEELLRFPACYGTLSEAPNEVIILEDLNESGFDVRSRFYSFQDAEVRLMLKNLATLHALGMVLKEKEPEFHEDAKNQLIKLWDALLKNEGLKTYFEAADAFAVNLLDDDSHKEYANGKLMSFLNEYSEEKDSSHFCIVQGECWVNNIMFKDGDESECVMIDYQASRVANPIEDVVYFIFNCTDKEAREEHYFEWIDYYYSIFEDVVAKFDMNASEVYSRADLDEDLKVYGTQMYGSAVFFLNVLVREPEEATDTKELSDEELIELIKDKIEGLYSLEKMDDSTLERFKTRLQGITESFIEYGYI